MHALCLATCTATMLRSLRAQAWLMWLKVACRSSVAFFAVCRVVTLSSLRANRDQPPKEVKTTGFRW
eukprot:12549158-Prorocentrum_lima.AAC.1